MGFFASSRKRARQRAAKAEEKQFVRSVIRQDFPDLEVRHGPFRGMKYPCADSVGSTLFPKLLGSYESELHPILETVFAREYTDIVDVGCAEGYYAVGLGLRFPDAMLHAYDVNGKARELCREMAELNGIDANRLRVAGKLDCSSLHAFEFAGCALIVSDCEGFEKELFAPETPGFMARHDFLIEAHDMVDIHISGYLKNIFSSTHDAVVIESVDDIHKAQRYQYPELEKFSLPERKILLSEERRSTMEWLLLLSRHSDSRR
ncbi:hypothetical protein DIT71_15520 [Marinobacter vulgaris]|uniref:Uncharacterized protein n=1 Tax=Marinobacter vulgaris TaxID=1928331 RepID=A0A2V3ZGU2_9GAMM|nr:methyltransferase [Marinobacter vulgaris]PXX89309.1 hypothetical protein DIT71_15520 [Marinobacter vulgaris]TSJ68128.1 methyltransferase [Marinobacter vulgaris]